MEYAYRFWIRDTLYMHSPGASGKGAARVCTCQGLVVTEVVPCKKKAVMLMLQGKCQLSVTRCYTHRDSQSNWTPEASFCSYMLAIDRFRWASGQ